MKSKKEPPASALQKDKFNMITGRVTKLKKTEQMKNVQIKLNSPPKRQENNKFQSQQFVTPFSKKSMITSTPFNGEINKPTNNGKQLLQSRLPLSPILSNTNNNKNRQNAKDEREKNKKDKPEEVNVAKENLPKSGLRSPSGQNLDPTTRIGKRVKPAQILSPENQERLLTNQNKDTLSRRVRVKIPKLGSSIESLNSTSKSSLQSSLEVSKEKLPKRVFQVPQTSESLSTNQKKEFRTSRVRVRLPKLSGSFELSSDSDSSKKTTTINQNDQSIRSCVFTDSSCSPERRIRIRHVTEKQTPATSLPNKENKESRSSRQRVRTPKVASPIKNSTSDQGISKKSNAINQNDESIRSCVFSDSSCSPDRRTDLPTKRIPPTSGSNNTLVKNLQCDWSSSTIGEKTSNSGVLGKLAKTPKCQKNQDPNLQVKQNKCSKLRVRLKDTSLDPKTPSSEVNRKSQKSSHDNTLVKNLKSDWSSTSIEEIPGQKQAPNQKKQIGKRRLTPLVEMSLEDRSILSDKVTETSKEASVTRKHNDNEDEYSSSAEFQSDDEMSNLSRSKRAPTWKELLNKTNESGEVKKPEVRLKRVRTISSEKDSPEKQKKKSEIEKEKHDKSDVIDKENRPTVKKMKSNSVGETTNDVPLKEIPLKRSTRSNSLVQDKLEEKSPTEKKDDDEMVSVDKENKAKGQSNEEKETDRVVDAPLEEITARRSRRISSKRPSPEKVEKPKQKEKKKKVVSNNDQVKDSKAEKAPNNKKEETKEKEKQTVKEVENVANKKAAFTKIKDNKQNSTEDNNVCKETTVPSSPQQNHMDNHNSPPHHNETEINAIDFTCPVKFFHSRSRLENTVSMPKSTESLKKRRSSKRKKQDSIYEFLSQSSSDSKDPVDDVIQKMIQNGKVVVAKHKKGTGKMTMPRNRVQKKKPTKAADKKAAAKTTKPLTEKQPLQEKIQDDFDDDGFHFDDGMHFDNDDNEIPDEDHVRDQRGFSNLARSAMIKQAGRIQKPLKRKPITDKKKLLQMAVQFVNQSTPVRMTPPHIPANISRPQFSPMSGNKSPWRVDDDKLPNTFYLGRNSDNLPSFSSDYIPMTPSKNKSKSLSSFSSNDSNGENTAPPGAKTITNEASLQALSNTRKALNYRSPLKAINILEVVNLPPLALHSYGKFPSPKNTSKNNSKENAAENISNHSSNHSNLHVSNENIGNQLENNQTTNSRKSGSDASNDNLTNLFGFEELIDDDNSPSSSNIDKTILPNKENLKERLERLKQLRPKQPVINSNPANRIKPVFDNVKPMQKTIKQMLCSTMIDTNQQNHKVGNHGLNESEDLSNLFKDLEPETTFDDSNPRRTYNRQFKRKRKVCSNYAMFIDSDVSDDEEEADAIKKPVKNYKPKPKKRQKENPDLNKFVNEFNEMCKEVSQYELVVE
ncbi:uncharacterized protein LOC129914353 [Episyrphus balteatus]|uniref:uncharacterized protein LOC129914353 n=1 Tax=Episyrphus balteatus TaxID=286459 RepID=UPI0024858A69|nr:uncharacterized protein LOC129914353 [Episyrphus balteatus]